MESAGHYTGKRRSSKSCTEVFSGHWYSSKRPESWLKSTTRMLCLQWLFWHSGFPSGKESTCQCRRCRRRGFEPWVGKIPWRRTHSSILAQRIAWTEEPGGLQSMGSQKSQTHLSTHVHVLTPTPVAYTNWEDASSMAQYSPLSWLWFLS